MESTRTDCLRCRRAESVCVCAAVRPAESRTRVVFLQHPREAKMPISTCRLAHLSLPNSEMHVAMRPEGHAHLEAVLAEPGTMVLFPGPGSVDVADLAEPPRVLVVVDGTWINARKLVQRSAILSALPRLGFTPDAPSTYRIRKEPAAHCLSTIEAVAFVLEELEEARGQFTPILGSFTRMVDQQLAHVAAHPNSRAAGRHAAPRVTAVDRVRALGDRLVLVFAEACRDGDDARLQWVAARPSTGARFAAVARPTRPLGPHTPIDIELPDDTVPEPFADAEARWRAFVRPDDVFGTWARHPVEVLAEQGVGIADMLDFKRLTTNLLHATLGGVEALAERNGAALPTATGRPARKLAALEAVLAALLAETLRARP